MPGFADLQKRAYLEQTLLTKLSTVVSSNFDMKEIGEALVKELKGIIPIDLHQYQFTRKTESPERYMRGWYDPEGSGYELTF